MNTHSHIVTTDQRSRFATLSNEKTPYTIMQLKRYHYVAHLWDDINRELRSGMIDMKGILNVYLSQAVDDEGYKDQFAIATLFIIYDHVVRSHGNYMKTIWNSKLRDRCINTFELVARDEDHGKMKMEILCKMWLELNPYGSMRTDIHIAKYLAEICARCGCVEGLVAFTASEYCEDVITEDLVQEIKETHVVMYADRCYQMGIEDHIPDKVDMALTARYYACVLNNDLE